MGANVGWSFGTDDEYVRIADHLNQASDTERRRFVHAIRGGADYGAAHHQAFPRLIPGTYAEVQRRWFSDEPFWFGHCELSPGQIQEIMLESRARMVELLLAGARTATLHICCGYPRMSATITWPGAEAADAELGEDARFWEPRNAEGQNVTLWVRVPFNSGYHYERRAYSPSYGPDDVARNVTDAPVRLARMIQQVTDDLAGEGIEVLPNGRVAPGHEPRRRQYVTGLAIDDVIFVSRWMPANQEIFRRTVLGTFGDGNSRPGRSGLNISFDPAVQAPPPLDRRIDPTRYDRTAYGMPDIPPRVEPGITITWP